MFDKYFGFLKSHDEDSIMKMLLDHARIDANELGLLEKMMSRLLGQTTEGDLNTMYQTLTDIDANNVKVFETVTDQIIQSQFDFQKQYDLLRLQQRIDNVSGLIIASAKRVLIVHNIGTTIPKPLHDSMHRLTHLVVESQQTFIKALQTFQTSRKDVIKLIHNAEEQESMIDTIRSEALEVLFRLGNDTVIKMGDLLALEGLIEVIEDTSDGIKSATTSLDWLLLS
jgi:uncharacterized protein Yka (UPF0111/DUF47 family)